MNSESWSVSGPNPNSNDIPGRRGYCHDVTCKKAVSKTSGIPENFFQRFQSVTTGVRLGIHYVKTRGFTHKVGFDRVLDVTSQDL
jgi:hypothetical protein